VKINIETMKRAEIMSFSLLSRVVKSIHSFVALGIRPRGHDEVVCSKPHAYVGVLVSALALLPLQLNAQWHSDSQNIMGTVVSVELWQQDSAAARDAMGAVMDEMRFVDSTMSPYINSSEIYRINELASREPVKLSEPLYRLIDKALYYSRVSNGAFDISFSSVGKYYDYRAGKMPDEKKIEQTLPAINYQLIKLDKKERTIFFGHPELKIDLGGIAKGFAVDLAIEQLRSRNIESAIVSAGGDSRILGERQGTPWMVGIRHPRQKGENAVRLPLENSAISTSGDYERFFIKGDERVHHIINPSTGKSAGEVQSVSVLAPMAVDSDALSTTVFVLGIKKGLALVNKLPGIDAIIIDAEGKMHYSEGLLMPVKKLVPN
jgi:FAD:protein FMN transferase